MYDVNQQKSDDVRVLKSTAALLPTVQSHFIDEGTKGLFDNIHEVELPDDYLHVLNCIVEYKAEKNFKCYDAGDKIHFGATRLTSDMFSQIINNYYMRPSYKQPYFYINNITTKSEHITEDTQKAIDFNGEETVIEYKNPNYDSTDAESEEFLFHVLTDNVERVAPVRYGNANKVRMEIRYGKDAKVFKLNKVYIDYLKAPKFIRLTQKQVDEVQDKSQVLEFQDYVCQEIVNELVTLLLENGSDPRLQTQIPINQSIANPQQEEGQQQRRR